jgi:hypothetical protein
MGEDIGDGELDRFAALQADIESEFAELTGAGETSDATHG